MRYKIIFTPLAFAFLAAAIPTRRNAPTDQCNTGSLQCCNSTSSTTSSSTALLLGLLGIVAQDVTALVGITCSPITAVGIGGTSCSAQPVCCTDNSFNGVVALGCTPINLSL